VEAGTVSGFLSNEERGQRAVALPSSQREYVRMADERKKFRSEPVGLDRAIANSWLVVVKNLADEGKGRVEAKHRLPSAL